MTSYGKNIKIEVFGGSHDSEIGITAENIPAGITFDMDKLASLHAETRTGTEQADDITQGKRHARTHERI